MEWFWFIIASLGAGIGTGLVGLSAATVMVPLLIVLCPSFSGETGAYQATAIALASDILGSAVTAYVYARHKNINLKKGWLMMACILVMCIAGSYTAYIVGNQVLGGFTLFLTFFIGIRFLIKPDTTRSATVKADDRLGWKEIAISIFFGLTIGFGTGFVGTGGGMMMLVVFTLFLRMDIKSAVGTSTFIMTFTSLIASVSHILIHPAIVIEKWHIMLVCMAIATLTSLFTARFANRVNNRTVGLVSGAVLTVLGAAMLLIHYWPFLSKSALFTDTLHCLAVFLIYIAVCVTIVLLIRFFTSIPSFIFRKLLHAIAFSCITLMVFQARSWQAAVCTSLFFAAVIYPTLCILEKESWYSQLFVEKSKGEIKVSMLMLFLMFAAIITVTWGIFDRAYIAVASILMWGMGDAAAAVIGIPYGRHKVHLKGTDGKKSWEGTAAMFLVSLCSGILVLYFGYSMPLFQTLYTAVTGAVIASFTELFSASRADTVSVPFAITFILLLLELFH